MELIQERAFARAGLVGNPSDGYHGKTISVIVRNFRAKVTLYEWDQLEVLPSQEDQSRFRSVRDLVEDVKLHGYYGGVRLVKATIKKFVEYCIAGGLRLHDRNFSVRYETNIPRAVGLAGSSAIIVATLRCLMKFYDVDIPRQVQPSLALSVETDELGIAAGLQDRVIQVRQGAVFMDFAEEKTQSIRGLDCGAYEQLDETKLPPLYIAYSTDVGQPTEVVHNDLRARYQRGEPQVVDAMRRFAELTVEARQAIQSGDSRRLGRVMDANFDLRKSICRIPRGQLEMIERARRAGASAKFAGSGGAVIGVCPDEDTFRRLVTDMQPIECGVIRPIIAAPED